MADLKPPATPPTEVIEAGSSRFTIAPEDGFRLMRWSIRTAHSGLREILYWPANPGDTPFHLIRGGNPLLFPFSGRSFDQGVKNFWHAPNGKRLPMPMHGFARECRFELISRNETCITGRMVPSEAAKEAYPFACRFLVTYAFEELAFTVTMQLENTGETAIPWAAGHHFYFTLPWHAAASRRDYQLFLNARKCAYQGPEGKPVPQKDRESCHNLADPLLLDRIHWELRHNRVSFGPRGGEEDVHIIIGRDPVPLKGYTIVTWSESEDAPFYCIEPWMGLPNAAEHGKGLHWVGPGQTGEYVVQVSLY